MKKKRIVTPQAETRLGRAREARHQRSRIAGALVKLKMVRVPYSGTFIRCICAASNKDDCVCIRAFTRSNMVNADSGVALSSKTA